MFLKLVIVLNVVQPFSLPKCLKYTEKTLKALNDDDLDEKDFVQELEARWRLVDADCSGLISLEELREAVWNNEPDNEGKKCPPLPKKLPKALQDIVDDIVKGTGSKKQISFWDFVGYVIQDREARDDITVARPPNPWAYAPEERHLIPPQ